MALGQLEVNVRTCVHFITQTGNLDFAIFVLYKQAAVIEKREKGHVSLTPPPPTISFKFDHASPEMDNT